MVAMVEWEEQEDEEGAAVLVVLVEEEDHTEMQMEIPVIIHLGHTVQVGILDIAVLLDQWGQQAVVELTVMQVIMEEFYGLSVLLRVVFFMSLPLGMMLK